MARVAEEPEKDVVYELMAQVCNGQKTMQEARAELHRHVLALDIGAAIAWRQGAVSKARRLMQISEAFSQELTVLGAGQ